MFSNDTWNRPRGNGAPRRWLFLLPALLILLVPPESAAQRGDAPGDGRRVLVAPIVSETGNAQLDALGKTASDTIFLVLSLSAGFEVARTEEPVTPESLDSLSVSEEVDSVVFGSITQEGQVYEIAVSTYRRGPGEAAASQTARVDGIFGVFAAADRLTLDVLELLTERRIGLGSLSLLPAGAGGEYRVSLNETVFLDGVREIPRMPEGVHSLQVLQERFLGEEVVFEESVTIEEGASTQVEVFLPYTTPREQQHFDSVDRAIRQAWLTDPGEALSTIEETLASLGRLPEATQEQLRRKYVTWREDLEAGAGVSLPAVGLEAPASLPEAAPAREPRRLEPVTQAFARSLTAERSPPIAVATIEVDGNPGDWEGIPPIIESGENDSWPGSGDIRALYAARDREYLYFQLATRERPSSRWEYKVRMTGLRTARTTNAPPYLTLTSGRETPFHYNQATGTTTDYPFPLRSVLGEVVEFRIPINAAYGLQEINLSADIENDAADADSTPIRSVSLTAPELFYLR